MGTLKYKIIPRKNPVTKVTKFYASPVHAPRIKTEDLVAYIAENSQIPKAIVRAGLSAIQKSIYNFVLNGHSVTVPQLGTFGITIRSKGALSEETFDASNIRSAHCTFRSAANIVEPTRFAMKFNHIQNEWE